MKQGWSLTCIPAGTLYGNVQFFSINNYAFRQFSMLLPVYGSWTTANSLSALPATTLSNAQIYASQACK